MKIGIIGPTGFSGSHAARELLDRGHDIVGFSRNPERLGTHPKYTPIALAIETAPVADLVAAFSDLDVLVNAYNPGPVPGVYKTFLETTRRIVLAVKAVSASSSRKPYLISIGGTASLSLPGKPHETAGDSRTFWLAYGRALVDSTAALAQMTERLGNDPSHPMLQAMTAHRTARQAQKSGTATPEQLAALQDIEGSVLNRPGDAAPSELPLAARAAFMMFESVPADVMAWSFVSPPARFRPGPRTGKYDVWIDDLPLAKEAAQPTVDGNEFDGRLLGVSAADLAVAIADEAEEGKLKGKHWSPTSEWEGDEAFDSYVKL